MDESDPNDVRLEPATTQDLEQLVEFLVELFRQEDDFEPNQHKQRHGLSLILESPSRGRIFVLRTDHAIIGMVNVLFTISTAEGGPVILMEDLFIHPQHRGQGYGSRLLQFVVQFARDKGFRRITLLSDRAREEPSQRLFQKNGFQYSSMVPMRLVLEAKKPNL